MSKFGVILWLPVRIALAMWAWLWGWTYPLARPSISEVRSAFGMSRFDFGNVVDTIRFALELPFMARAQHYAERSISTRTQLDDSSPENIAASPVRDRRWLTEPGWRSGLREAMVWSTAASWLITWGSVGASFIFTGNFLFESHATPDAPGYVTPYFKVAAAALVLPVAWVTAGFAVLGVSRRSA